MTEGTNNHARVLIVEDNPEVVQFIGECLNPYTQVPQCTTIAESLAQLKILATTTLPENVPNIMIFGNQYQLGESGIDVLLTEVGGKPLHTLAKPALFSTSADLESTRRLYRPLGVGVFIPKPTDVETFRSLIAPLFTKEAK